tara:strand:- start:134953 stop:135138 length:186 start_codon:yes stop_codon:yes gene_type:complete
MLLKAEWVFIILMVVLALTGIPVLQQIALGYLSYMFVFAVWQLCEHLERYLLRKFHDTSFS